MRGRVGQSGEYVSAHVSQADKVYQQLIQSGGVESYRQSGDTVYFRTAQPPPTHRRRSRWWIVGGVLAFFIVAGLLKAGLLAVSTGTALAGVLLFGVLVLIVHKLTINGGFLTVTIGSLIVGALLIGGIESIGGVFDADAAARTNTIAAECGGVGSGDIQCRWDSLVDSVQKTAEVAQSPESEGLGTAMLVFLVLLFGGGWLYWRRYVDGAR